MSSEQRYVQHYQKAWEDNFFTLISNKTVCLLCGFEPSRIQKSVIERHYKTRHFKDYSEYVGEERYNLIEGLKLVYRQSYGDDSISNIDDGTIAENALTASYKISNIIAKRSKAFADGEFVKDCLLETVKAFGGSLTVKDVTSIALSSRTVASRISNIAGYIKNELESLLATCSYFSLCLDESTDNRHISQLSIFFRIVQGDFSCIEELLDFIPMHGTTTGADIFKIVEQTLKKYNTDFSKCSAMVTDGAKAMTGIKNGLCGQLKQRNIEIPFIHCIIHREALCGKAIKLSDAMQTVTKITNFIKGGHRFLLHRKFQQFLTEHNAAYTDVPLHCAVRWLSAGKCLQKFFAIRKEILLFLQEPSVPQKDEFIAFLENFESLSEIALITDITNHLNILNLQLQKTKQSISELVSHIDCFHRKLILMKNHLEQKILHFFPSCQILYEEHGTTVDFTKYMYILESIKNEFETRFTDMSTLRADLILFENPLTVQIEEQSLQFQEVLCKL